MAAVTGAGIALGGLLLIFIGFLFGQSAVLKYMSPPAPKAISDGYRRAACIGLIPFAFALLTAAAAILFWLLPNPALAYWVVIAFIVCTIGSILYGALAARKL